MTIHHSTRLFNVVIILYIGLTINNKSFAQIKAEPLKMFDFYIGEWGPPSDHPMIKKNPKTVSLRVISLKWGSEKKSINSKTGIRSNDEEIISSEGFITYNPNTGKNIWIEYQMDNDILFEGEYLLTENGSLQRVYKVYYEEGYSSIPNPQLSGWTRLFRETFTPTHKDSINWLTEAFVNGQWINHGRNGGDFKAVRIK